MKTIGVIPNKEKDKGLKYTDILLKSISSKGGRAKISSQFAEELFVRNEGLNEDDVFDSSDIIICLGGDGTFLKAARKAYSRNIPVLGINLGSLGFLTEVDKDDIENAVENILCENYCIEERMMLEATVIKNGSIVAKDVALNDVVISKGALSRILHLKTYTNNAFVDIFPGDGLIVASPTGSTAYSLSAGGPIVEPDNEDLIIITPICPHILYSRSFITRGNRVVKIVVDEEYYHSAMVTVDGQTGYEIKGGDSVEIRKSEHTVKMVRMQSRNFFDVLRTKIYGRGENLRKDEI